MDDALLKFGLTAFATLLVVVDRRARHPLVDVALRVRRVRGTARTGWPGAGSEDSGDAVGIWSLLSLSRCFSGDGA